MQSSFWKKVRTPASTDHLLTALIYIFPSLGLVVVFGGFNKCDSGGIKIQDMGLIFSVLGLILAIKSLIANLGHSILSKLMDEWSSPGMYESLVHLSSWRKKNYPESLTKVDAINPAAFLVPLDRLKTPKKPIKGLEALRHFPAPKCIEDFGKWTQAGRSGDNQEFVELDKHRRRVFHFFHRAHKYANYHSIGAFVAKDIFAFRDMIILWQLLEPLNEASSVNDRSDVYDWYRCLWRQEIRTFSPRADDYKFDWYTRGF
jgi:hypothetical protein